MKRWAMVIVVILTLGTGAQVFASAQDKVKEATERAAKDYLQHGLVLSAEGQDEAAVKSFQKVVAMMPQWAEAHSLLGSSLARAGNLRDAEAELRKAIQLKPDYAEGWYYLGQFYQDRAKEKEAQEAFRKAQQLAR